MSQKQNTKAAKRRAQKSKKREQRKRVLKSKEQHRPNGDPGPKPPREVPDVHGMTADEVVCLVRLQGGTKLEFLRRLRYEKHKGVRPLPSARLVGETAEPAREIRRSLVDEVARLVDENIFGRSNMCFQFANLLARALRHLGYDAAPIRGIAKFRQTDGDWFEWDHAWVRYSDSIVDGNADSMKENPLVPPGIAPDPYWGSLESIPDDREYDLGSKTPAQLDEEDVEMWWKDLRQWIERNCTAT